jgi:hypothetical protein
MDNIKPSFHSLMEDKSIMVSYYNSCYDETNTPISIMKVFELIRTGEGIKTIIEHLRNEPDKVKAGTLKKNFQQLPFQPYLKAIESWNI